jgi:dUTPase
MKVFRLNEKAKRPVFLNRKSPTFDIKACFDLNTKIRVLNSLNKETFSLTKKVNEKIVIQVYPQQRILIPTGLIFEVPAEHALKIYSNPETSNKKGLVLVNGIDMIKPDYVDEVFVLLHNVTDAVTTIEDGDCIAQAMLEKAVPCDITEVTERPSLAS